MVEHEIKTETILKCWYCKEEIVLETTELCMFRKKPYHRKCLLEKETSKKRGALKIEDIPEFLDDIKDESQRHSNKLVGRSILIKWIQIEYNMVILPSFVINKLDSIIDGKLDGLLMPIPPDHMLDMWKMKFSELRRIEQSNIKKGRRFKKPHLVSYDMSIIANKYESYLDYLKKQELIKDAGIFAPNRNQVLKDMKDMMISQTPKYHKSYEVSEHEEMLHNFINSEEEE